MLKHEIKVWGMIQDGLINLEGPGHLLDYK